MRGCWALLALLCAAAGAAGGAKHHAVFWNGSNTRLARGDLTLHVHLDDHLDIICPHYDPGRPAAFQERYALFLVSASEHRACAPSSADQLRWRCDRPAAPHGAERFSEKFQRFTAFSLGKEFREGSSYYYISQPLEKQSEKCLRLKVTVLGRGAQASPSQPRRRRGGFTQTMQLRRCLRSVGQNAAMRGSSPFTLITLLLPLLVPGGL